jgi:hypothetical protein
MVKLKKLFATSLITLFALLTVLTPALVFAQQPPACNDAPDEQGIVKCKETEFNCDGFSSQIECVQNNPIVKTLLSIVNFLTVGVGAVVIIMVIIAGIQYSTAQADPQKVAAAKKRISNALMALLAYLFLGAFLQWVVPGGLF